MARLGMEEFKNKYSEKIVDNDELLIELLEDISDSLADTTELDSIKVELEQAHTELEEYNRKYDEIKKKYIDRFLNVVEDEEKEEIIEDSSELEEKEVIDIKEI